MAAPAPAPMPVHAAATSIFSFFGAPPGTGDIWLDTMEPDPWVQVEATEDYHQVATYIGWRRYPAAPADITHYHCRYSDLELLHGCHRTADQQILGSSPYLRYTVPSQLSHAWDAIKDSGKMGTSAHSVGSVFANALLTAAQSADNDSRLDLVWGMTRLLPPTPDAAALASRWPVTITTKDHVAEPSVSLFNEGLMLRRAQERFTHIGRAKATHTLALMMEGARAHICRTNPDLAPLLRVHASVFNLDPANYSNHLGPEVGRYWKGVLTPPQMIQLPVTTTDIISDLSQDKMYLLGDESQRKLAFTSKLECALVHYPEMSAVLVDGCLRPASTRASLYKQLALEYLPEGYDVFTTDAMDLLEPLVAATNTDMRLAVLAIDQSPQRVLFHSTHRDKLRKATKAEEHLSSKAEGSTPSNKVEGVKTAEYQKVSGEIELAASSKSVNSNQVQQMAMTSGSKLLWMYFAVAIGGVPGFRLFSLMASHRGRTGQYFGCILSSDDNGNIPRIALNRHVAESVDSAMYKGNWYRPLDLYDLACTWDAMLEEEAYESVDVALWFKDNDKNKLVLKYGLRLFQSIGRCGTGVGSFGWVMEQGMQLLENRKKFKCLPSDVDELVQWWFEAALEEAGADFKQLIRVDTDFTQPLHDVFLTNKSDGCMVGFQLRRDSIENFSSWARTLPNTVKRLLSDDGGSVNSPPSGATYSSQKSQRVVKAMQPASKRQKQGQSPG